ncbi:MAG TPA: Stp1/IreP family PP2C-type Ser/Thr phosphatase [Gaiella sp.]|jgi:protein phosphatase
MRIGRAHASTDTGRRRLQNEDIFVCRPPLFAVADGMGGAQAGELASRLAAAALEERAGELQGEEAIAELVREANARIFQRAVTDPAASGMGTTATVALQDEERGTLAIAHVGDSRAYRLRDGQLEQLTLDHSVVGELVRAGRLTEEEALQHPYRSAITRALGTEAEVDVDTLTVETSPGDLYLICSDGLTTMLRDDEILAVAAAGDGDPARIADALVGAANAAGGEDNVTVVLFEIVEGEPGAPRHEEADTPAPTAAIPLASPATEVSRTGAGRGGRWPALLLILLVLAVAALLVWWGITK